jgi:hypothetical protein
MDWTGDQPVDFFISRAGADKAFAAEIGRILENAGHSVVLQQWDFKNQNFMNCMHRALCSGARVIALLSREYLQSDHCAAEWLNAIADDPLNKEARLIVVRVAECAPEGLLKGIAYWDLLPIRSDPGLLKDVVLAAIDPERRKDAGGAAGEYWRPAKAITHPEIRATPSFTGREKELAAIDEALWSGGAAAVTQPAAIHGLGGIGKSVLAREYAFRNQNRYAGVWWLNAATLADAEGFEGIESALVDLGALFIRDLDKARDRAAAARQALAFIADGGFEKPWLLVYDNVDDRRALRDWAPLGNAHVLVTSRLGGWSRNVSPVEVEEWAMPEAVRYLEHASGRDDLTGKNAETIAEALGRLPLALSHAAAYLRDLVTVAAEDYVEALAEHMAEAPEDADYPRAVFATFQEAAKEAESRAPGALAVLSLAAFYAPDAIPEELFQQQPGCYPPPLAPLAENKKALNEAIGRLHRLSLVEFDPARRVFSVHRLVQAAARDALAEEAPIWAASAATLPGALGHSARAPWNPGCRSCHGHAGNARRR